MVAPPTPMPANLKAGDPATFEWQCEVADDIQTNFQRPGFPAVHGEACSCGLRRG